MSEEQKNDQTVPQPSNAAPQPPVTAVPPTEPMPQQQPPMPQPQPTYSAPQPQPQAFYPPAPLMQLTGGMKFAWLVVGALMGIPGIIIAWLVNADKVPQVKSDALKFAIIGFVVWIVLGFLMGLLITGMVTTMVAGALGSMDASSYGYHGSW